jgi:hypothetical protein
MRKLTPGTVLLALLAAASFLAKVKYGFHVGN